MHPVTAHGYNLGLSGQPGQDVQRMQAWKFIQKLRILENEINVRAEQGEGAYYPYSPRAMMTIDTNSDFNVTNTISDRADFEARVKEASYDKPVLVKFGLTYCAHCLLLEQLGSVPAVAERYADEMDVYKLWWNPHDAEYNQLNTIAGEEGITSSPMFILYKDGEVVGRGTSGGYGWRCGKSLALGLVRVDLAEIGTELEIEILGEKYQAIVIEESPFDPTNECLRS